MNVKILEWGIYLVVFSLPLYLVRLRIFSIPTNVLEAIVGVLFLLWLIYGGFKRIKRGVKGFKEVVLPIILILIGVSLATIFSWDLRVSAGIWKSWFVVPLLFFIILVTSIKEPSQVKKIFYAFIFSGLVVAIISLVYLIQDNLDGQGRLQGPYGSPNHLAMYLAPASILGFGLWTIGKKRLEKILLLIVSCFLFYVLWHTYSFGAWIGIIAGLGFGLFLYLQNLNKKKLTWLVVVLGIVLILTLVYLKGFVLPEGGRSFDARFVIWQKAWQVFKMYPVIGIGPGTFQDYFPLYPKWGVPQPHNLYLAFLLQTGLIGFIGFIWLLSWFFHPSPKASDDKLKLIVLMAMTYILTHGLVDTTYWKNDLATMFWLFIGLMTILKKEPR